MKTDPSHDPFSGDDSLDELFTIREMAPADFATRTLHAVRAHQRRARIRRLTAAATAVAASVGLIFVLAIRQTPPEFTDMAATAPAASPEEEVAVSPNDEELMAMLYPPLPEDDVMFYGQVSELEQLLEEAVALSNEENLQTLDMLFLLAQN